MTAPRGAELTMPRVAGALAVILVLAIVVPYLAVRRLHERRLVAADAQAQALADAVRPWLTRPALAAASGVLLLSGAGTQPRAVDDRWTGASMPLSLVLRGTQAGPDPWGNAFIVIAVGAGANRAGWVLSAGPDGIIETPFPDTTLTSAADDRLVAIR
jgi:hypothetical protein